VVLSASQAASGNYAAAAATTSFVVATPFTLTPTGGTGTSGGSATTTQGVVATFSLALTPGSAGKLLDPITFTATGLPVGGDSYLLANDDWGRKRGYNCGAFNPNQQSIGTQ
jgi:hypothetical protein